MSVPLGLMYGYEVESFDDPAIVAAENSMKLGAKLILPGSTIANIFPVLLRLPEWVPGAGFKKLVNHVYHLTQETKRIPLEFVKRKVVSRFNVFGILHFDMYYAERRRDHLCLLLFPTFWRGKWLLVLLRKKSRRSLMLHTQHTEVCNGIGIFQNDLLTSD